MKFTATLLFLAAAAAALAAERPAGSISKNVSFAVREGDGFRKASLSAYEGKIVVIMMMTPWCPICQSHASEVGDGLLDYFYAASRNKLRGKNAGGVPIESILLSTEEAAQWDPVNSGFSFKNGFRRWGIDANPDRTNPRTLLGYFRGGFLNSSNLYDWGDDRRRLVVINLVRNSPTHRYREIIINRNTFSSRDFARARAAINAIKPVPAPFPASFMRY